MFFIRINGRIIGNTEAGNEMKERIKQLFSDLDRFWNMTTAPNLHGEHPGCQIKQTEILEEIVQMDVEDVKTLINELTDEQLNQIISIMEEIIENFPETAETFIEINSKRDIYWLNDELKLLKLV